MKFLRNSFAFLLIPAVCAAGYTFVENFLYCMAFSGSRYTCFWIGVLGYVVFQVVFYRPIKIYVFGHELSHAITGILSGAKIKKFSVGKQSGSVALTKDNIWITLAPYFFPIYTLALIIVYIFLGWFINIKQFYEYFLFLIGFSIAFHVALTAYILSIEQPDLKVYGVFFSYIVIFAVNIITFTLLVSLSFPEGISVKGILVQSYTNISSIYKFIFHGVLDIWSAFLKAK
ncbi:MAG: hypothetical protein LBU29_03915 [Endomicrobium sp.]|jgi:hypothetical protein|nr:hypothetical protein [Endomicrobium sp.]